MPIAVEVDGGAFFIGALIDDDINVGPCSRSRRLASCNARSAADVLECMSRALDVAIPGVMELADRSLGSGGGGRYGLGGVTTFIAAIPSRPKDGEISRGDEGDDVTVGTSRFLGDACG